jgi:hypothetical protein
MVGESLSNALRALKDERSRLDDAIQALEGLAAAQGAVRRSGGRRRGPGRPRKPGRPRGAAGTARGRGRRRKNAPRGLLRAKIVQALKDAKKPLRAVELRNAIMKSGYPVKNKQTLYSAIFAAAKKEPLVKKSGKRFQLK